MIAKVASILFCMLLPLHKSYANLDAVVGIDNLSDYSGYTYLNEYIIYNLIQLFKCRH